MNKLDGSKLPLGWGDLRVEGYIGGKVVIERSMSGRGDNRKLILIADDETLLADGADATRVVVRVTDQYGAVRTYADDPISFELEGNAKLIGDNPFSLVGGVLAVWVRAGEEAGTARLTAKHARLGKQTVTFRLISVPAEEV